MERGLKQRRHFSATGWSIAQGSEILKWWLGNPTQPRTSLALTVRLCREPPSHLLFFRSWGYTVNRWGAGTKGCTKVFSSRVTVIFKSYGRNFLQFVLANVPCWLQFFRIFLSDSGIFCRVAVDYAQSLFLWEI